LANYFFSEDMVVDGRSGRNKAASLSDFCYDDIYMYEYDTKGIKNTWVLGVKLSFHNVQYLRLFMNH